MSVAKDRPALINAIEAVPARLFEGGQNGKDALLARLNAGESVRAAFTCPFPPPTEPGDVVYVPQSFRDVVMDCPPVPFADRVRAETDAIARMLIEKNAAYGNSALDPLRVFSTAAAAEQIRVRIDDKLSRLARGSAAGEDVILDLIGYLILLRMAETKNP
jgi:hypothetical protein